MIDDELKLHDKPLPGVEFDFGGGRTVLLMPPISFGALERLQARIDKLPSLSLAEPEARRTIIDAAHAALQRNYPRITRDTVAELVDPGNLGDVYQCVMDIGGMMRKKQAADREAAQLGNGVAEGVTSGPGSSPE